MFDLPDGQYPFAKKTNDVEYLNMVQNTRAKQSYYPVSLQKKELMSDFGILYAV